MPCFRTPFGKQRVKGFQSLFKSARHHYYRIFPWIRDKMSWKKPVLVWSEILRLFVSTLTPDGKYIHHNMQNLQNQLQTPISQKEKTFSAFFIAFLECASNSEHFEKKDKHLSLIISEIIDSERVGCLNV